MFGKSKTGNANMPKERISKKYKTCDENLGGTKSPSYEDYDNAKRKALKKIKANRAKRS